MIYEPLSYWKAQGKDYYKNFVYTAQFALQENNLIQLLDTLEFKSVLELGCGFGRITKLISNYYRLDKYTAIDFSVEQLNMAKVICPDSIEFVCTNLLEYKPTIKYDLVIAVEVLMHLLPKQIHQAIDKMISWSNQHVISVDYYGDENLHYYTTFYMIILNYIMIKQREYQ